MDETREGEDTMLAPILLHPRAVIRFDPPTNPVEAAIRASERERLEAERLARRDRDFGKLELTNLVEVYGFENVEGWLKTIKAMQPSPGTVTDPRR